jgi:lipopolysaccharide biosynthesis glycosyltransferase
MKSPLIVYTNLFTLTNRDVKVNKYIDMYYIWLFNIFKYGQLNADDYCVSFIDEHTLEYIENKPILKWLSMKFSNFVIIPYAQPKTIKEGILKRYDIDSILEVTKHIENPAYLYLDIDVLVMNDIRPLFRSQSMQKTTLYLRTEGVITNHLYYGDLITPEEMHLLRDKNMLHMPGFSAGIYGWNNNATAKQFFRFIIELAAKIDKELYTVEQPFFNAAVFNYFFKEQGIFNIALFDQTRVIDNHMVQPNTTEIILINFCGIPGDDSFHWDKLLQQLFIQAL